MKKINTFEGFATLGGIAAAIAMDYGMNSTFTHSIQFAGVVMAGVAYAKIFNPQSKLSTSAFLTLGGVGLLVASNIVTHNDISHTLNQLIQPVFNAGFVGFSNILLKKIGWLKESKEELEGREKEMNANEEFIFFKDNSSKKRKM